MEVREVEALVLHAQDWQRLSMSDGTKGPRLFDWAAVPILHHWEDDGRHWLLIRRSISDPTKKTYYFVFGPHGTTLHQMVTAIGARWHIEDDFENSKDMGLDQYEVRSWTAWYRHITLVMLAYAFLVAMCAKVRLPACESAPAGSDLWCLQPLLKRVVCLVICSGLPLRARSWCWPGRGGAAATAVVPAITIPNAGWRQDKRSVAVIAFSRLSSASGLLIRRKNRPRDFSW